MKEPVAVVTGIVVLVSLDWRFSLTTCSFPDLHGAVLVFGRKIRQAGKARKTKPEPWR